MSHNDEESSQSRSQPLPPLAPRDLTSPTFASSSSSSRDRTDSARRARLSHRSRAGCWTCRGRKVKCDENRPRCGQCTRLGRDCDWEHRWQFSDATTGTQIKHTNVSTAGNSVWDPSARSSPSGSESPLKAEDLPPFSILTNDEDRERLAGSTLPGTYSVVVTPDSFAGLPEYAPTITLPERRRSSARSNLSHISTFSRSGHGPTRRDPNLVILDRFEDASPATPSITSPRRRTSLPNPVHMSSIDTTSPIMRSSTMPSTPAGGSESEARLIAYFRQYVAYRIIPRVFGESQASQALVSSMRGVFEIEASRFPPLYHAICALSALSMYYCSQARFEDALDHYSRALANGNDEDDFRSNGSFLRHFLLFVYDISITDNSADSSIRAVHLAALQRIVAERSRTMSSEPYAYIIWLICSLDMYASLLGNGDCAVFGEMLRTSQLPTPSQQQPQHLLDELTPPELRDRYYMILKLNHAVVVQTAKIAQAAHTFRIEYMATSAGREYLLPRFTARITQLQDDLVAAWTSLCPPALEPVSLRTSHTMAPEVRVVFENVLVLFHTAIIYSRTSMFPGQRLLITSNHSTLSADTEARVDLILGIAEQKVVEQALDQRSIVFPIFMAGFVTRQPDSKIRAIDVLKAYEGTGIGQNTTTTRKLLTAVYDAQSGCARNDRLMEEVEWMRVAEEKGLRISNCGL